MQKIHIYYVYMLTNKSNGVLYTGVTNGLLRRCYEHKKGLNEGFTKKYNVHKLVYYEIFDFIDLAFAREKQIKGLSRDKKNQLIEKFNPQWTDLYVNGSIIPSEHLQLSDSGFMLRSHPANEGVAGSRKQEVNHRETNYFYDSRQRIIKKEVIHYHPGGMLDASSPPQKRYI